MLRGFKNNLNTYKDLIWLQAFQLSVLAPLRALRETKKLRAFAPSCLRLKNAASNSTSWRAFYLFNIFISTLRFVILSSSVNSRTNLFDDPNPL